MVTRQRLPPPPARGAGRSTGLQRPTPHLGSPPCYPSNRGRGCGRQLRTGPAPARPALRRGARGVAQEAARPSPGPAGKAGAGRKLPSGGGCLERRCWAPSLLALAPPDLPAPENLLGITRPSARAGRRPWWRPDERGACKIEPSLTPGPETPGSVGPGSTGLEKDRPGVFPSPKYTAPHEKVPIAPCWDYHPSKDFDGACVFVCWCAEEGRLQIPQRVSPASKWIRSELRLSDRPNGEGWGGKGQTKEGPNYAVSLKR